MLGTMIRGPNIQMHSSTKLSTDAYSVVVVASATHGPLSQRFLSGETMRCFLGISPTTSAANHERLDALLAWLSPKAPSLIVVEGSFPSRWNLIALKGLAESDAIETVNVSVRRFRRRVERLAAALCRSDIAVIDWPNVIASEEFKKISSVVSDFCRANKPFADAVNDVARGYILRVHSSLAHTVNLSQMELLRRYALEELSMFLYLYSIGCHVEVYPGADLEIMRAITAGEFSGFPIHCPDRTHIGVELIRR